MQPGLATIKKCRGEATEHKRDEASSRYNKVTVESVGSQAMHFELEAVQPLILAAKSTAGIRITGSAGELYERVDGGGCGTAYYKSCFGIKVSEGCDFNDR